MRENLHQVYGTKEPFLGLECLYLWFTHFTSFKQVRFKHYLALCSVRWGVSSQIPFLERFLKCSRDKIQTNYKQYYTTTKCILASLMSMQRH